MVDAMRETKQPQLLVDGWAPQSAGVMPAVSLLVSLLASADL